MADRLAVLLDQNVPRALLRWLQETKPSWDVHHASAVGLAGKSDREVFQWAQSQRAVIITFDEDFADRRSFPVGKHHRIVRLRVWPTTDPRHHPSWRAAKPPSVHRGPHPGAHAGRDCVVHPGRGGRVRAHRRDQRRQLCG